MGTTSDRRSFLRLVGMSMGVATLYQFAPRLAHGEQAAAGIIKTAAEKHGEAFSPFSFVQLSDTHVGFNGAPDPLGTRAFERAVAMVNQLPQRPDLVLFTGDLTHDSEDKDVHSRRMRQFKEIAGKLEVQKVHCVPGEHDAALDGGALFRETIGETSYSFDHRGVHFIALDNVSRGKPEVGAERLAWLAKDLARFAMTVPIVVFTHRPLFDLKPEWEWFTNDGDKVMNVLAPYENVTVLYGHIHRHDVHKAGNAVHYAARSLIFAFPDTTAPAKKPLPFDQAQPFRNLGIRAIRAQSQHAALSINDVELTMKEFSGTSGMQQFLKPGSLV